MGLNGRRNFVISSLVKGRIGVIGGESDKKSFVILREVFEMIYNGNSLNFVHERLVCYLLLIRDVIFTYCNC